MAVSTRASSVDGLSLREFDVIVFPAQSSLYELAQSAFSDSDLVFKLHLRDPVRWTACRGLNTAGCLTAQVADKLDD